MSRADLKSRRAAVAPRDGSYEAFLETKRFVVPSSGVDVDPASLHPAMRDHQRYPTALALRKGRMALWKDTGCIAGDTIIESPDGDERIDELASRGGPFRVWALSRQGCAVIAWAAFAFEKGRAALYEFTLDDGRSITVTAAHRFLTPLGWRHAGEVAVGGLLAVSDPIPLRSTEGPDPSASPRGVLDSIRTGVGSLSRYSSDSRRYGPRLHQAGDSALASPPSPSDVLAHNQTSWRTDGQARTPESSHRRHLSAHPSTRDSHRRDSCTSDDEGCCAAPSRSTPPAWNSPVLERSDLFASRPQSTRESDQHGRRVLTSARTFDRASTRQVSSRLFPIGASLTGLHPLRSPVAAPSLRRGPGPLPTLESAPYERQGETPSALSFRPVVSVKYIGEATYYDMHVPVYENYSAHGFWNHNTGKTLDQLVWAEHAAEASNGRALILAPLAVSRQTVREGIRWGIPVHYARSEADAAATGITITNYEMLDHFDPSAYGAVVLDESSILRNFSGVTKKRLVHAFRNTPFRLACTATPAPNDVVELCNHADFLGVMNPSDMLTTFFISKGSDQKDGKFRLKSHARKAFFRWLASWALACRKPSDLGYSDEGYELPPLDIRATTVPTDYVQPGQLFATGLKGVTDRAAVRRGTIDDRVRVALEIAMAEPDEQWLIWGGLNDETEAMAAGIPGAVEVRGSDSPDSKADALEAFAMGNIRVLVTKVSIAGFGMNFQNCARQLFVGIGDSYEQYYQALRRSWRFGQTRAVVAHIVLSDLEQEVYNNVLRKERDHAELTRELVANVVAYERDELARAAIDLDVYAPTTALVLPSWLRSEHAEDAA